MIGVSDFHDVPPPAAAEPDADLEAPAAEPPPGPETGAGPDPLTTVTAERDQYLDDLRRLQAEFENFRKRTVKQQTEHLERAAESLVRELLPVLDAIDLARAHTDAGDDGGGLEPVANQLVEVLRKEGLDRIDPKGQPFDPLEHDAVLHEPAEEGDDAAPEVSEVMRAGYRWRGRVLRPAMVKVRG